MAEAAWRGAWWHSPTCSSASPRARRLVGGERVATTFLSGISAPRSPIPRIRFGDDPRRWRRAVFRRFATNVTISASVQALLVPPAIMRYLFAGDRRHDLDHQLFMAGVVRASCSASPRPCLPGDRLSDGHPRGTAVPLREAVKISFDALWA